MLLTDGVAEEHTELFPELAVTGETVEVVGRRRGAVVSLTERDLELLELTAKRSERYAELVGRYAGDRAYDLVWWFTPNARVAERMRQVVKAAGMGHRVEVRTWQPR